MFFNPILDFLGEVSVLLAYSVEGVNLEKGFVLVICPIYGSGRAHSCRKFNGLLINLLKALSDFSFIEQ